MCVTHSAVRCRKRIPRPHHSRWRFCFHAAYPCFRIPSPRGGMSLGFLVGLVPFGSILFPTVCFTASSRIRLPCEVLWCHKLDPIVTLASPSRHRCVPLYSPVVHLCTLQGSYAIHQEDRLLHHAVVLHSQKGTNSRHDWKITFVNGPRHSRPNFARDLLGQQRQSHLPPTVPKEPQHS